MISDKCITFDYNIENIIEVNDLIIVLLKIPYEVNDVFENIYAFNLNGEIKWRVDCSSLIDVCKLILPFENINIIDDYITATDFYGFRCFININNGKIEHRDFVK